MSYNLLIGDYANLDEGINLPGIMMVFMGLTSTPWVGY
jgi:hypothetical protein